MHADATQRGEREARRGEKGPPRRLPGETQGQTGPARAMACYVSSRLSPGTFGSTQKSTHHTPHTRHTNETDTDTDSYHTIHPPYSVHHTEDILHPHYSVAPLALAQFSLQPQPPSAFTSLVPPPSTSLHKPYLPCLFTDTDGVASPHSFLSLSLSFPSLYQLGLTLNLSPLSYPSWPHSLILPFHGTVVLRTP